MQCVEQVRCRKKARSCTGEQPSAAPLASKTFTVRSGGCLVQASRRCSNNLFFLRQQVHLWASIGGRACIYVFAARGQVRLVSDLENPLRVRTGQAGHRPRWPSEQSNATLVCQKHHQTPPHVTTHCDAVAAMRKPGIEPGSYRWQRCILPLDH